jgi:glutamine synthetase
MAGLDGFVNRTSPGPLNEDPYAADVPQLPTALEGAVDVLENDQFFHSGFGDIFIDYLITMKRSEITPYAAWGALQGWGVLGQPS